MYKPSLHVDNFGAKFSSQQGFEMPDWENGLRKEENEENQFVNLI